MDIHNDENIRMIIKNWLDKILKNLDINNETKKQSQNIDLSTFYIIELLNNINSYLYKNNNNINTNITTIINGNKTIIQVYNPILLSLFHKKQLTSNWTYLQNFTNFKYEFRCNLDIHLHQSKSKSYIVSPKKKKSKSKINSKKTKPENKELHFNQFFDSESD